MDNNKKLSQLNNILNGKTVLVVDDDVRNIYSLTKALESVKMKIVTAIDGKEAIKAMHEHKNIDAVLLDMMMPNMDGPTTLKQMQIMPALANTTFAFMTAKVQPQEVAQLTQLGAKKVIAKPFDPMTLADTIRSIGVGND